MCSHQLYFKQVCMLLLSRAAVVCRYAIATASAVVLDTLQARCKRLASESASRPSHGGGNKGKSCSYSINYS